MICKKLHFFNIISANNAAYCNLLLLQCIGTLFFFTKKLQKCKAIYCINTFLCDVKPNHIYLCSFFNFYVRSKTAWY